MRPNLHRLSNSSSPHDDDHHHHHHGIVQQRTNNLHIRGSSRPSSFHTLLILAHCLGLACSIFVLAWVLRFRGGLPLIAHNTQLADSNDLVFNVHPVFMLVGFIVLTSEAILVFKGVPGTKSYKKAVHLTIQALAFVLAMVGIWAAFKYHGAKRIDNFYSLHSWLGISTVLMFSLQWIFAFIIYWYPGAAGKIRTSFLPWHVFLGLVTYCWALVTAETGLLEKVTFLMVNKVITRFSLESTFVNCLGLLLVGYGAVVILVTVRPRTSREDAARSVD